MSLLLQGCRVAYRLINRPGQRKLPVLIFHQVLERPDPLRPSEPCAERFRRELGWLTRLFTPLPLSEALDRQREGTLPADAITLTFDDGYANNATVAAPLLCEAGIRATFFVASDYLDGGTMWNDLLIEAVRHWPKTSLVVPALKLELPLSGAGERLAAVRTLLARTKYLEGVAREQLAQQLVKEAGMAPPRLMMSRSQLCELVAMGMEIGGHTCSHPILAALTPSDARWEISENKRVLESLTGVPLRAFAYPNGKAGQDFTRETPAMVAEAGYDYAVTTVWGSASPAQDRYQLPRFRPWSRTPLYYWSHMVRNHWRRPAGLNNGTA